MDKFDDLLKDMAKSEADDFTLPKSFNSKVENLLENIDEEKAKNNWYLEKKTLAMVACFAFVFFVGIKSINMPNTKSMTQSDAMPEVAREAKIENYSLNTTEDNVASNDGLANSYGNGLIDVSQINNITMKVLGEKSTYKWVDKKEDIENVIGFINSLEKTEMEKQDLQQWDILMQTAGSTNHSVLISGNILNIDDAWYEIDGEKIKELIKIYDELSYEEKDIKYCNF